jgi:hypothetical protein
VKLTHRQLVSHFGQHRKPKPSAVPGALVGQRFVTCAPCGGVESAATVYGDGVLVLCAEGHEQPLGGA